MCQYSVVVNVYKIDGNTDKKESYCKVTMILLRNSKLVNSHFY